MAKITYTLASLATSMKKNPKVVRAKFRRLKKERPFDHTKVDVLTPAQVVAAKKFINEDFRNV